MKDSLLNMLKEYLKKYPSEEERQKQFIDYLKEQSYESIIDWDNFDGHIVASGLVYALKEKKFLVIFHNDLKMFLYPGGHVEKQDKDPLAAALREVHEETGLQDLIQVPVSNNELMPLDISVHKVRYNERLNLPEHYHFDFRYLFLVEKISEVKIDESESSSYKWISAEEFSENPRYGWLISKIEPLLLPYEKEKSILRVKKYND